MPLSDEQIDVAWLSADDSITTYEHFRRHVARAIESAVSAPLLAQIAALEAQLAASTEETERLRTALKWYADEAKACAKNSTDKSFSATQALLASVTVLALDGGRRADAAIDAVIAQEQ